MERDVPEAPQGDDRSARRPPRGYRDDGMRQGKQRQRDVMREFAGSPERSVATMDWGQLLEDFVVLAGLAIRGVCLLVTWPVRWAWRRMHM